MLGHLLGNRGQAPRRVDSRCTATPQSRPMRRVCTSASSDNRSSSPVRLQERPPATSPPSGRSWLVEAVPRIVSGLRGTSALHVVHSQSRGVQVDSLSMPEHPMHTSQLWEQCSSQAQLEDVNGVVLVRPIADPSLSDCPLKPRSIRQQLLAAARSSSSNGSDSGSDSDGSDSDSDGEGSGSGSDSGDEEDAASYASSPGTSYYGVVVQSSRSGSSTGANYGGTGSGFGSTAAAVQMESICPFAFGAGGLSRGCDGCYVLKVCESPGAGPGTCNSRHYSLTRVCQGQPLYSQLWESWIA